MAYVFNGRASRETDDAVFGRTIGSDLGLAGHAYG